jgi:hypothetical protein
LNGDCDDLEILKLFFPEYIFIDNRENVLAWEAMSNYVDDGREDQSRVDFFELFEGFTLLFASYDGEKHYFSLEILRHIQEERSEFFDDDF